MPRGSGDGPWPGAVGTSPLPLPLGSLRPMCFRHQRSRSGARAGLTLHRSPQSVRQRRGAWPHPGEGSWGGGAAPAAPGKPWGARATSASCPGGARPGTAAVRDGRVARPTTRLSREGRGAAGRRGRAGAHLQDDGQLLGGAPVLHAHRQPHLERGQLLGEERAVLWDRQRRTGQGPAPCVPPAFTGPPAMSGSTLHGHRCQKKRREMLTPGRAGQWSRQDMCAAGCGEGRGPQPKTPRAPNRSTRKGVEKPVPWERAGNPGCADLPVPPGHLSEELKQVVAQAGRGPDADTTAGAGAAQTWVQSRRALLAARGHWRGSGLRAAVGGAWRGTQDGRQRRPECRRLSGASGCGAGRGRCARPRGEALA